MLDDVYFKSNNLQNILVGEAKNLIEELINLEDQLEKIIKENCHNTNLFDFYREKETEIELIYHKEMFKSGFKLGVELMQELKSIDHLSQLKSITIHDNTINIEFEVTK